MREEISRLRDDEAAVVQEREAQEKKQFELDRREAEMTHHTREQARRESELAHHSKQLNRQAAEQAHYAKELDEEKAVLLRVQAAQDERQELFQAQ